MNKVCTAHFIRVTKKEARNNFKRGGIIRLCPCKLNPENCWGMFADVQNKDSKGFELVVDNFAYYNCSGKTGRYPAFYIRY